MGDILSDLLTFESAADVDLGEDLELGFIALSKDPIVPQFSWLEGLIYVAVETASVKFKAKNFYLDHDLSFHNAIGNITDHKMDEKGNLKIKVRFFEEIKDSKQAYLKYKNGLSNAVSVGIVGAKLTQVKENGSPKMHKNRPLYQMKGGEIVEVSAVWQGADSKATQATFKHPITTQGESMTDDLTKQPLTLEAMQNAPTQPASPPPPPPPV